MNVLIVLGIALLGLTMLWTVQSIALKLAGEPLAWPLRFTTKKPAVRWTARVMIHTTWIAIIIGTPLALGITLRAWFQQEFPTPVPWRDMAIAFSVMFFPAWIGYAVMITAGWVQIVPQHDPATRHRKLLRRFIGPIPLATLEEAVFRGVLLEQLLRTFPQTTGYTTLAILLSAAVFSSVHFVKRPYPGKPIWQPAYGLFIIGCLLGLAYVVGGRSLWLPIVMHAAAVFVIELMRLYAVFRAAPWLIGYAEWPEAGFIGSVVVLFSAVALVWLI